MIAFICRVPFIANIILIVGLSVNKLYRISYPFRSLDVSEHTKTLWGVFVVTLAALNPLLGFLINNLTVEVHYNALASVCRLIREGVVVVIARLVIYIILPSVILMGTNIALIGIAMRKTQSVVNKRNIVVVLGVTLQFLLAFIPYTAVLSVRFYHPVPDWLVRGSFSLLYLSCWFNPFVYYLNNPRFKEFTNNVIRWCWVRFVVKPSAGLRGSCRWRRTVFYQILAGKFDTVETRV